MAQAALLLLAALCVVAGYPHGAFAHRHHATMPFAMKPRGMRVTANFRDLPLTSERPKVEYRRRTHDRDGGGTGPEHAPSPPLDEALSGAGAMFSTPKPISLTLSAVALQTTKSSTGLTVANFQTLAGAVATADILFITEVKKVSELPDVLKSSGYACDKSDYNPTTGHAHNLVCAKKPLGPIKPLSTAYTITAVSRGAQRAMKYQTALIGVPVGSHQLCFGTIHLPGSGTMSLRADQRSDVIDALKADVIIKKQCAFLLLGGDFNFHQGASHDDVKIADAFHRFDTPHPKKPHVPMGFITVSASPAVTTESQRTNSVEVPVLRDLSDHYEVVTMTVTVTP